MIAYYIVFLDNGKVIDEAPKDEFMDKYVIIKASLEDILDIDRDYILGFKKINFFMK